MRVGMGTFVQAVLGLDMGGWFERFKQMIQELLHLSCRETFLIVLKISLAIFMVKILTDCFSEFLSEWPKGFPPAVVFIFKMIVFGCMFYLFCVYERP